VPGDNQSIARCIKTKNNNKAVAISLVDGQRNNGQAGSRDLNSRPKTTTAVRLLPSRPPHHSPPDTNSRRQPVRRHIMKLELLSASNFLVHLIRLARKNVGEPQLQKFRDCLVEVFRRRYRDHWFPEKPFKGSGYRCIRINGKMDPMIGQAGEACGLQPTFLHKIFPSELTMWIDPLEVSYRIGENGSICVLYEYKEGVTEPWRPALTTTNNNSNNLNNRGSSSNNKNNVRNLKGGSELNDSTSTTSCKEALCTMDYLLDPRKSVSIEQLAAYVSS
jgi:protein Tob/BTG